MLKRVRREGRKRGRGLVVREGGRRVREGGEIGVCGRKHSILGE